MQSKFDELQAKVDKLSSVQLRLQKGATDLRSQLKASEALISDLNKKSNSGIFKELLPLRALLKSKLPVT
jgi:hypothetical protein